MKFSDPQISWDHVVDLLSYESSSGNIYWKKRRGSARAGALAGCKSCGGYQNIRIDDHLVMAHRLAWFIIHKEWPRGEIDHIDGNRLNNRLENLRVCAGADNAKNKGRRVNNKSGVTGVFFNSKLGKWVASIRINGKAKHCGLFIDKEDAVAERMRQEKVLFGKFAPSTCRQIGL